METPNQMVPNLSSNTSQASENPPESTEHINTIVQERLAKLANLRKAGVAYPNDFMPKNQSEHLQITYGTLEKMALEAQNVEVSVAGRMMLKRIMGKASFVTLQDGSGQIQLYINDEGVGLATHESFKHWDLGDIIAAQGTLFKTNKGELSIRCHTLRLLTKSIAPMPDKFHGLVDQELRYRQRYLDLIANGTTRKTFLQRSQIMMGVRQFMTEHQFLEVETPMLHPIPGGAAAKPFITHHNALDMQMYLRIAPELYLKRLIVGGMERVFEINRNFRNEGVSPRHNPEFTMMEFYAAYTDYRWLMNFTEDLLRHLAISVTGSAVFTYQDMTLDFSRPFDRLTIVEAMRKYEPALENTDLNDIAIVKQELSKRQVDLTAPNLKSAGLGALQLALFEATVEAKLWNPVFIIDYPVEVSPLARASDSNPLVTERFELFIAGREIANGFSELNDPQDQAQRFKAQAAAKDAGDEEAMYYDADYIRALEYGMPPTGGCGIGIDRLVMLLTNCNNIRDVILFPHLRPE